MTSPPIGRFGIAYNAALKLCTILLYASGYRHGKTLQHYRTIAALPLILGNDHKDDADYLDTCRAKRNTVEYEMAGAATKQDAVELVELAKELREEVLDWLKKHHPELLPQNVPDQEENQAVILPLDYIPTIR